MNLANEGIRKAVTAAKTAKARLANLLSRYDEFYFSIEEGTMEEIAALVTYLQPYAVNDDEPVAIVDVCNGKPYGLTIFIHQKMLGTANHVLIKHRIAEFMIASNAVFKNAKRARICANCVYGHKEPHCPYAGEVTMYYTCKHWRLWQL